mmetsp:Transcript_29712/g.63645  ORF Transcript_29712/g.63645 Transcript_29712/m.63645 type:complete len:859 (+) Transcript_29712:79-2655(+)
MTSIHENSIDIEACIRSSSIILELAKEASKDRISGLSLEEKQALISSLDEVVKFIEVMKGTLLPRQPFDGENEVNADAVTKEDDFPETKDEPYVFTPAVSPLHEQIDVPHRAELDAAPNQFNGRVGDLQRRLSTPYMIREESTLEQHSQDGFGLNEKGLRKRSYTYGFFSSSQTATVHPQNEDIESVSATEAFNLIDKNGDGYLQQEEVSQAIEILVNQGSMKLKEGETPQQKAMSMMKEVDVDGDGQIDMFEFQDMLRKERDNEEGMSHLVKKVLDAHQKKKDMIEGEDMWLIHPLSPEHAAWDILVSLLILLTVITMPLSLGWEELNELFYDMNLAVDFIFMIDVIINFCTGIVGENDKIIMDAEYVRRNYLTGFFVTDFCSSVPLDLILRSAGIDSVNGTVTGTKQSLKMLKLLRMAKLFRLFRINRLFQHIKRAVMAIEEALNIRVSDGFTKLMRLGIGALVLAHWIGCFNFMLVRLYNFPSDSWVVYAGLNGEDPFTQWSWAFFKALAQMIMIGFETPPFTNVSCDTASEWCSIENWITLGCLYLGAIFYSLLISSISSILQTANQASRLFDEHLLRMDDYMRTIKLPTETREKVKEYFYLQYSNGKLHKESEILDFLSPILRREIKEHNTEDIRRKVPLLRVGDHSDFAMDVSCVIESTMVFENETIFREKTTGDEMYFIHSGVVEIVVSTPSNERATYLAIGDGCYFGDVSLLLGIQRTASVESKTQCMLYRLKKKNLLSLLKDYPSVESKMIELAKRRRKRLAHHLDPQYVWLEPDEEVDAEDSRTDLFGVDAKKIKNDKDNDFNMERIHSGIKPRRTLTKNGKGSRRRNATVTKEELPSVRRSGLRKLF